MPFKRPGRPSLYFKALTRAGTYAQLSTGVTATRLAQEIESMWRSLARDYRAWDVLEPVLSGQMKIGVVLDAWRESRSNIVELRQRLNDVDLTLLVPVYLTQYAQSGVAKDTVEHAAHALRWLFPEGRTHSASRTTTSWLSERLASYPASASTRRKVRSEWNGFFRWVVEVRQAHHTNPLTPVSRPTQKAPPIEFYELDEVKRIVDWQPSDERRALFALLYGTGCEISVALTLTRADIDPKTKMIRARGTKTHTRDRMIRVDDWAWNTFWDFAKLRLNGRLFSAASRHTSSKWHRATAKSLGLGQLLPMKNARHHWAATHLRSGWPIHVVQTQLGHASPTLTLNTYGRFIPNNQDYDRLQESLRRDEETQLVAVGGAR
jgi:integrase